MDNKCNMEHPNVHLVRGDAWLFGLTALLTIYNTMDKGLGNDTIMSEVWFITIVYVLFRLFLSFTPRLAHYILLTAVALFCLLESGLGLMQLIGIKDSHHYMYAFTGSFNNPGPYGGFLAVCLSLLGAYAIKGDGKRLRYLSVIIAIPALILLPSTMSRAAILSLLTAVCLLTVSTSKGKLFIKKNKIWLCMAIVLVGTSAYLVKKPSAD